MSKPKAVISWSSGKDSALALHRVLQSGEYEVTGLVTTVYEGLERVAVHDVREKLLEAQALSIGLPLHKVRLPPGCPNAIYERRLSQGLEPLKQAGATHIVFGDLFLADIRHYRERLTAHEGMQAVFPLWLEKTGDLAREIVGQGIRAVLTAVDLIKLPASFSGRTFDEKLLRDLPAGVDPCGENGEFHTFVVDGPMFSTPLSVRPGNVATRGGFAYTDLSF